MMEHLFERSLRDETNETPLVSTVPSMDDPNGILHILIFDRHMGAGLGVECLCARGKG